MADENHDAVTAALKGKLVDILDKRAKLAHQQQHLAAQSRVLDRDLADLRAGARILGVELDIPKDDGDGHNLFTRHVIWQRSQTDAEPGMLPISGQAESRLSPPPAPAPRHVPRPPIRDIILDRLRAAGDKGSKAAPIRDFIERVYGKVHEKTVGMTLYRLANNGAVRREGHTWFLAKPDGAETRNPGVLAPGSESPSQRKEEA